MGRHGNNARRVSQNEINMSTLTIQMPDGIAQQLREIAEKEGVTVDQLVASAAAEKLSALMTVDYLRERARRGKREDIIAFLDQSPAAPSMPGDEI